MESLLQVYLDENELIREYTEVLVGKRKRIASFYSNGIAMATEKVAITILKYAFEHLLHWSPDTALEWFNRDIAKQLKLEVYVKMFEFPMELDPRIDYWYAVYKVYPDYIPIDTRSLTIRVYEQLLQQKRERFPVRFFSGIDGQNKAAICLNYAVNKYLTFVNLNEYYAFFAGSKGVNFVKEVRLTSVCKETFADVLEYANYALHQDQRNEFLYNFQRFCQKNKNPNQDEEEEEEGDDVV